MCFFFFTSLSRCSKLDAFLLIPVLLCGADIHCIRHCVLSLDFMICGLFCMLLMHGRLPSQIQAVGELSKEWSVH